LEALMQRATANSYSIRQLFSFARLFVR